jgi:hypothetical protein
MPIEVILATTQKRSKDSFAASSSVGLVVRANGEEKVKVIDARGNVFDASIDPPTVAPTFSDTGTGNLTHNKYAGYLYVYASSKFPFVANDLATNGQVYPKSNPGPADVYRYIGSGDRKINVTVTKTTNAIIDRIWIFRTALFASESEAETAAAAGQAFFIGEVLNNGVAGTMSFEDNVLADGTDQVQVDNYVAPQFQFVVYHDPYWWGFGNMPFVADITWANTHTGSTTKLTLTGSDTWFDGRDGQNVTFEGVTTGGYDNLGTFKFKWLTSTTATVTIDGTTPVAIGSTGSGTVTIQGPATTLYRSKADNPFSWGHSTTIGEALIPEQYAFRIGGGLGTALALVPNNATLKLDCELPTQCYTLNLKAAGTSAFESTLRSISTVYSVSAHHSQFPATTQSGQTVLWGFDFKNFAILQSDGVSQIPVSQTIPKILRGLTVDRTRQLLTHGCYDARTELNCMWVASRDALSFIDLLIYQHAPTGFWGFSREHDVLSSATIHDTATGENKTFLGTQTGFLGQGFAEGYNNNWCPSTGVLTGSCSLATSTSITITGDFNIVDDGMVGNWVLITDPEGDQEQLARISAVTLHTLTFDWVIPNVGYVTTALNPVPQTGWLFYVGLIECELLKYFDFNMPQTDKRLMELWLSQQNVDGPAETLVRFYRERANGYAKIALSQSTYQDGTASDAWYAKQTIPSELVKMFGLKIINRGYTQWKFVSMVLKPSLNP